MVLFWIKTLLYLLIVVRELSVGKHEHKHRESDGKDRIVVKTSLGSVMGFQNGSTTAFLGVPFAEPPTGRYRFRPSRPKRPWYPSTYEALDFGSECLQSSLYSSSDEETRRDEDCLYLNIWRPANADAKNNLYPVLLWIYGGAFLHGAASRREYFGDRLASRGVVVVSFNYRLGALGFLVSTSDGLFGNYGLHDQKLAMQWVQEHIRNFGGDPDRVTLFGESAGAMSIGLHLLDQQHRQQTHKDSTHGYFRAAQKPPKLFHAVILQSNPLGYKYRGITVANFIGASYKERLDCEDLRCLQSESADELLHVQDTLLPVPRSIGDFFAWGPVVTDHNYYREMRFNPGPDSNITVRQPMEAVRELRKLDVPVVIGSNAHEGTVFVFTAFPTRMAKIIYQTYLFGFFRSAALSIMKRYAALAKQIEDSPYPDYRLLLSRIIGDYLFRCPNQLFAARLADAGACVYNYEFALATQIPGYSCCDGLACHTSELPYVFEQINVIQQEYSYYAPSLQAHLMQAMYGRTNSSSFSSSSSSATSSTVTSSSSPSSPSQGPPAQSGHNSINNNIKNNNNNQSVPVDVTVDSQGGTNVLIESSTSTSDSNSNKNSNGGLFSNLPDIFGAATSWITNKGTTVFDPLEPQRQRLLIDSEVARLMADYWTTFAMYGDPNGLPSRNGIVGGTRPRDAPWWPRLRGELHTKQAIKEMQLAAAERAVSSASRSRPPRAEGDYELKEFDLMDLADLGDDLLGAASSSSADAAPPHYDKNKNNQRSSRRRRRRRSMTVRESYDPVYGGTIYEEDDDEDDDYYGGRGGGGRGGGGGDGGSSGSDDEEERVLGFSFSFGGGSSSKNKKERGASRRKSRSSSRDDSRHGGGTWSGNTIDNNGRGIRRGGAGVNYRDDNSGRRHEGEGEGGGSDNEGEMQWWWGKGTTPGKGKKHSDESTPSLYKGGVDAGEPMVGSYDSDDDDRSTHDAHTHKPPDKHDRQERRNDARGSLQEEEDGDDGYHDQEWSDYEDQTMIIDGDKNIPGNRGRSSRRGPRDQRLWEKEQQRRYAAEADARMQQYEHREQRHLNRGSFNNKIEDEQEELAAVSSSRFMHLMKFDDQTDVDILKNDCICQFWNKLDYRF